MTVGRRTWAIISTIIPLESVDAERDVLAIAYSFLFIQN